MACPNTLATLERLCDITLGFKSKFHVARADEIDAIPAAVDGVVTTDITMLSTNVFYAFDVSKEPGKSKITATTEGDADSSVFKIEGAVTVPGSSGEASAIISDMRKNEYVGIIEDRDGQKWILGAKDDGIMFKPQLDHDGAVKQYTLNFEAYSKILPLQYTGTIPIS